MGERGPENLFLLGIQYPRSLELTHDHNARSRFFDHIHDNRLSRCAALSLWLRSAPSASAPGF